MAEWEGSPAETRLGETGPRPVGKPENANTEHGVRDFSEAGADEPGLLLGLPGSRH